MSVPLAAPAPDVRSDIAPNALSVLNSVFGLPGYRGAQEEIVRHVTNGGNCLVLMPTGADIEAILQHAHSLGAVIDVSNERNVSNLMPAQGSHPLAAPGRELIILQTLADVRFGAHYGLKSDIAPGPKSANSGNQQPFKGI